MRIHVGSQNPGKIESVQLAFAIEESFQKPVIEGVPITVPEFGHPKNITETINGARARARAAWGACDMSVGLEGGLMEAPGTRTGFFEVNVCVLFDGAQEYFGLSPGMEWPKAALDLILSGHDGSQAMRRAGFTQEEKIGNGVGVIGLMTGGKITRIEYMKHSVTMALAEYKNKELYNS